MNNKQTYPYNLQLHTLGIRWFSSIFPMHRLNIIPAGLHNKPSIGQPGFFREVSFVIKPTVIESSNIEWNSITVVFSSHTMSCASPLHFNSVSIGSSQRFYGTCSPIIESIEPAHSNNINFIHIQSDAISSSQMAINGIGDIGKHIPPYIGDIGKHISPGIGIGIGDINIGDIGICITLGLLWIFLELYIYKDNSESSRLLIRLHPVCINIVDHINFNLVDGEQIGAYHKGVAYKKVGGDDNQHRIFLSLWANNSEYLKYVEYTDPISNVVWCIYYEWSEWYEWELRNLHIRRIGRELGNQDYHVEMEFYPPNYEAWRQARINNTLIISGYNRYFKIHTTYRGHEIKLRSYESYFFRKFNAVNLRNSDEIMIFSVG